LVALVEQVDLVGAARAESFILLITLGAVVLRIKVMMAEMLLEAQLLQTILEVVAEVQDPLEEVLEMNGAEMVETVLLVP
jgi:hypothetical protein